MPRTTDKKRALQDIEHVAQVIAGYIALSRPQAYKKQLLWKNLEVLFHTHSVIHFNRYLSRSNDAGRHQGNILDNLIHEFSDERFLNTFRMHRSSFWQLVQVLEEAGGAGYWDGRELIPAAHGGRPARPSYQQIAVALYVLGTGAGRENSGINLNIGKGTVSVYMWRVIKLLIKLLPDYIRWPTAQQRREYDPPTTIFRNCIGFLDGSVVVLKYKPMLDSEAYYSRKSTYGFNLQAICDWERRFIWVSMSHTASAHDSTVFKSSPLYRDIQRFFTQDEYVLADKAYALERHVITPYKDPIAKRPTHSAFNYALSTPRVRIEHAFGILKARWPSLSDIPLRIGEDVHSGHQKVIEWTMACLVLHNMLAGMRDDESWLRESLDRTMQRGRHDENDNQNKEVEGEAKRAGTRRREDLRELVAAEKRLESQHNGSGRRVHSYRGSRGSRVG